MNQQSPIPVGSRTTWFGTSPNGGAVALHQVSPMWLNFSQLPKRRAQQPCIYNLLISTHNSLIMIGHGDIDPAVNSDPWIVFHASLQCRELQAPQYRLGQWWNNMLWPGRANLKTNLCNCHHFWRLFVLAVLHYTAAPASAANQKFDVCCHLSSVSEMFSGLKINVDCVHSLRLQLSFLLLNMTGKQTVFASSFNMLE